MKKQSYAYTIGGKKGTTFQLEESNRLVAIRTSQAKPLSQIKMSKSARKMLPIMLQVASIPEANVSIFQVVDENAKAKPKGLRDKVRAQFKKEKSIRFAGRVLCDKKSRKPFLYTENFFLKFHDHISATDAEGIIKEFGLTLKNKLAFASNAYFCSAKEGTGFEIFAIAQVLLEHEAVEFCHPELITERRHRAIHPMQWHLHETTVQGTFIDQHVDIEGAWAISRGSGAVIAVIDDGVDIDHEEFSSPGKIVAPRDTLLNSDDARPKFNAESHGTACAGVACADGVVSASGAAPDALLMPIRSGNLGSISEANAFYWAADNGADVISCSWGPADGQWWNPNDPLHTQMFPLFDSTRLAIDYAITNGRDGRGCVICWAAGNGRENVFFDGYASYDKVMAVAACNDRGTKSVYSDFGKAVHCCFPSSDREFFPFNHPRPLTPGIWTTDRSGQEGYNPGATLETLGDSVGDYTATFGGTSSSCPGVAGVCAIILSINPALSYEEVREIIQHSCDRIDETAGNYDGTGHSLYYGFGRINARKAAENAQKTIHDDLAFEVVGNACFSRSKDVLLEQNKPAGQASQNNRLLGFEIKVHPVHPELKVSYTVKLNRMSKLFHGENGAYAGTKDRRRKAIGLSAQLQGPLAEAYTIEYAARFKKGGPWAILKNGAWLGSRKKRGKPIRSIKMRIYKNEEE